MKVRIKKLYNDSILPTKAHDTDAGYDLYAHSMNYDNDGNVVYGCGIAFEIPKGYVGLVFPRSSNAQKDLLLSNSVGVVDSGFRGEISFKFKQHWSFATMWEPSVYLRRNKDRDYRVGERIGQIVIMPYPEIELVESDSLSDSDRGTDSYGSSGK